MVCVQMQISLFVLNAVRFPENERSWNEKKNLLMEAGASDGA